MNPFREILDGKDLSYLLLLMPYISDDSATVGIIQKYDFSPDGKVFTAQLSKNLTWGDGTKVTSNEAALGIAKGLRYRSLGKRLKVIDGHLLDSNDWHRKKIAGIQIIDETTFTIKFVSEIENVTGVVREALSSGSRQNRMWPVKIRKDINLQTPSVLGKFPIVWNSEIPAIKIGANKIDILNQFQCKNADFNIYKDFLGESLSSYSTLKIKNPQAITAQINTQRLDMIQRREAIAFVRSAFKDKQESDGIESVNSFFLLGEPGFDESFSWESKFDKVNYLKNKTLKIAYEAPVFRKPIEDTAKKNGLNIKLITLPSTDNDIDIQILSSAIKDGRQIILQDILKWPHVTNFLSGAKKTKLLLEEISNKSASTIPITEKLLQEFEKSSKNDGAWAPVGRRFVVTYSNKKAPLSLVWENHGELNFKVKE
ncbi:MAG: hypothetical protein ACK5P5_04810 [Pseudobdellovibrionaceae bacterium]